MNAFEFGQVVGAGLEKQANKYKFLTNLIAPAANAAAPAATKVVSRAGTAAPSWVRHNQAVARGINPATGLKPGAVAPAPPPPPTAPKITITPEQAAAATPLPTTPGLRTTGAGATPGLDPATLNWLNRYSGRPGGTPKPIMPGAYNMSPQEVAAQSAMRARASAQAATASGQTPNVANMGLSAKPFPSVRAAQRNYGSVPTGTPSTAQAQSFFDNATSGGRQRMLGIDPQGRGVPSAPQSWAQLSPAQQAAVQKFYSGGK